MDSKKSSITKIIIWAVVSSVLVNVFFSRFLTARLSTWPLLNRLGLLDPQAPIVIRETREIRVSPEGEINDVLEKLKNRVSLLGVIQKDEFAVLGNVLNFTSDGIFLTSSLTLPAKSGDLRVRLADGSLSPVEHTYVDQPTGLVFLKTQGSNLPISPLADSAQLRLGDRILFLDQAKAGLKYYESLVNFISTQAGEAFGFQDAGVETSPGVVAANYKAEVLGLWHNNLVPAQDFRSAFERYQIAVKERQPKK